MVVDKQDALRGYPDGVQEDRFDPKLFAEPRDHRLAEHLPGSGKRAQLRQQDAFELGEGLLVEDEIVQIVSRDPGFPQAISDSLHREAVVELDPAEPLFLRRGHERSIAEEGGGRIVVEGRYAEDVHYSGSSAGLSIGAGRFSYRGAPRRV